MISISTLKSEAKQINSTAEVSPILFTLLFFGISFAIGFVTGFVAPFLSRVAAGSNSSLVVITFVELFLSVFVSLFSILLNAGYTIYIMGVRRGERMPYSTLFDGFAIAGKIIALQLLRALLYTVGFILLFIPGIIVAYCYSFALYNLLDNPSLSVLDAMRLSRQQTKGVKWDLFLLSLSFIGWYLLTMLTFGILTIYVSPWLQQSFVGAYRAVTGGDAPSPTENNELPPVGSEN